MTYVKKLAGFIAALMVALLLSAGVAATAFAADNGKITITNTKPGQTYSVYKMLDLESYNSTTDKYAYKPASGWEGFFNGTWTKTENGTVISASKWTTINSQGYVLWSQNDNSGKPTGMANFAKFASEYAKENLGLVPTEITATGDSVEFTNLPLGYYLIGSTTTTVCALDTTNPEVEIASKAQTPSNQKSVMEDSTGQWGGKNDADIGDVVAFKSAVTIPGGSKNIIFHDVMTQGLSLCDENGILLNKDNVKSGDIAVYADADMKTPLAAESYTVSVGKATVADTECTFEIKFSDAFLDTIPGPAAEGDTSRADASTQIVYVKYFAKVNQHAVIGGEGNSNTSKVSYGEANTMGTGSTTTTYVWEFNVHKTDGSNTLAGAKFILYKNDNSTTKYAVISSGKLTSWTENRTDATEMTSLQTGNIVIQGLDADVYYLEETAAPTGYNKLKDPITVTIASTNVAESTTPGSVTASTNGGSVTLGENNTIDVVNLSGPELPSTGDMGTTIFYVLGGILVVATGILLIARKRMGSKN